MNFNYSQLYNEQWVYNISTGERDLTLVFKIQTLLDLYSSLMKSMERPPGYSPGAEGDTSVHDQVKYLYLSFCHFFIYSRCLFYNLNILCRQS